MKMIFVTVFWLYSMSCLLAQSIILKNGTEIGFDSIQRSDAMLVLSVNINGRPGSISYYASDVQQIQMPEPPAIDAALGCMAKGNYADALAQIDPLVAHEKGLRDIPGNWWGKSAVVKVSVYFALKRKAEAQALAQEIQGFTNDPEILAATTLQLDLNTAFKKPELAVAAYDEIINHSSDPQTLSQAWIGKGDAEFQDHKFEDALLAYLTVVAFYPDNTPFLSKAIYGSGKCYFKLKDIDRAKKTFHSIITSYADTPEASLASQDIATIQQLEQNNK